MKKTILTLAILLISTSNAFAWSKVTRERAAEGAQIAAVAIAKASQESKGNDDTAKVNIYTYDAEEVARTEDISKIEVKVGFDSGRGEKYFEKYSVEINQAGHVLSVKFIN